MSESNFSQEVQDSVSSLYIAFFGRAPDADGFNYWCAELSPPVNTSPFKIAADFALSPEWQNTYGSLTDPAEQVNLFYQNSFGRDADPDGLAYWVAEIDGGLPFSTVAYQIIWAAYLGGPNVDPNDNAIVNNKIDVSEYFAVVLASNDTVVAQTAFFDVTTDPASVPIAEARLAEEVVTKTVNVTVAEAEALPSGYTYNLYDTSVNLAAAPVPILNGALSATITGGGTVAASTLTYLSEEVPGTLNASSITGISGTATEIVSLSALDIIAPTNFDSILNGVAAATEISNIKDVSGTGTIDGAALTEINGTAEGVLQALTDMAVDPTNFDSTISNAGAIEATVLTDLAGATTGNITSAAVTSITGTAAQAQAALDNAQLLSLAAVNVTISDAGAIEATVLTDLASATTGNITSANVTSITGTAAQAQAALDNVQLVSLAAVNVTISDAGAIEATVLTDLAAATTGNITSAAVTSITGTAAQAQAALDNAQLVSLAAVNVTISDAGAVAATVLTDLAGATTGNITSAAVTSITGTAAQAQAALVDSQLLSLAGVDVTISDTGAVAATVLTDLVAATTGDITSANVTSITGTAAEAQATLDNAQLVSLAAVNVTISDTGAVAATVLTDLANSTTGDVDAQTVTTLTGTVAEVLAVQGNADITLAENYDVTLDAGVAQASDITAIKAANGTGTIDGAALTDINGTAGAVVQALTELNPDPTNFNSTLTGVAQAADIIAIADANGTGTINGAALTEINGTAAAVTQALADLNIDPTNFTSTIDGSIAIASNLNAILTFEPLAVNIEQVQTVNLLDSGEIFDTNEFIYGSTGFTINGDIGNDTIIGGDNNDTITGGAGADELNAGAGANEITDAGMGADDITHDETGSTVAIAVTGSDTVTLTATQVGATATAVVGGNRTVNASTSDATGAVVIDGTALIAGQDGVYTGGAGEDTITGGAGEDTITGGAGADVLNAGAGANEITDAGMGADDITHDETGSTVAIAVTGSDTVTLTATQVGATATADVGGNRTVNASTSDATGAVVIDGTALIAGQDGVYTGGAGEDTITGGAGNDTIIGGAGSDVLTGGLGTDLFIANGGDENAPYIITDLGQGGADTLIVTQGGFATANIHTAWTADSGTKNEGSNNFSNAVITTAGLSVNLSASTATVGYGGYTINNIATAATLIGSAASDSITGGDNNDTVIGGDGDDTITGGTGADSLTGGDGNDTFLYVNEAQLMDGFTSSLVDVAIVGGEGTNRISVDGGLTVIAGDVWTNASSIEELFVTGTAVSNVVLGTTAETTGIKTINISSSTTDGNVVDVSAYTALGITILGSATATNVLTGGAGNDTITGGYGNDTITGGVGNDMINSGLGANVINAGIGQDVITVSQISTNTINLSFVGASNLTTVIAQAETGERSTTITAGTLNDEIDLSATAAGSSVGVIMTAIDATGTTTVNFTGGNGDDLIIGFLGADTLIGGLGNDTITGGGGNDSLIGNAGNDTFNFTSADELSKVTTVAGGANTDTIMMNTDAADLSLADADFSNVINIETLALTGTGKQSVTLGTETDAAFIASGSGITITTDATALSLNLQGSASNLSINATGTNNADTLTGGAGNDTINGGDGNDTITGVAGADSLTGGDGIDTFIYNAVANISSDSNGEITDTISNLELTDFIVLNLTNAAGFDISNVTADSEEYVGYESNSVGSVIINTTAFAGLANDAARSTAAQAMTILNVSLSDGSGEGFVGGINNDTVLGGNGNDTITGGAGNDTITGEAGNDSLTGGSGVDTFNINVDVDAITDLGVGGQDVLVVSAGATANANVGASFVATAATMNTAGTATLTSANFNVDLSQVTSGDKGFTIDAATSTIDVILKGSAFADLITGGAGNDTITGGAGVDSLDGGDGVDVFKFASAAELAEDATVIGGADYDYIQMTAGTSLVDADFTNVTNLDALILTGVSSAVLGGTAENAGINLVILEGGDTTITLVDDVSMTIDASAMPSGTTLTINGSGRLTLTSTDATIDASAFTDQLTATVVNTVAATVQIGTGATSVSAQGTDAAVALTIDADAGGVAVAGALMLANGGAVAGDITVIGLESGLTVANGFLGTGDLSITTANATQTIALGTTLSLSTATVNADALTDGQVLNLTGTDEATVTLTLGDLSAAAFVGNLTVTATTGSNVITTGSGADTIDGGTGNDTITGGSGVDIFNVNADTDTITDLGQGGADHLVISQGAMANATIHTAWTAGSGTVNSGTNTSANAVIMTNGMAVNLNAATVAIAGSATQGYSITNSGLATTITGSAAADSITGRTGEDTIHGGNGADTINGGSGDDLITGGVGDDLMTGDLGADTFNITTTAADTDTITDWGLGTDVLAGNAFAGQQLNVTISDLSTTAFNAASAFATNGVVSVTGSKGNDTITGGASADTISGGDGNDTITGGAGADSLTGGNGSNTFLYVNQAELEDGTALVDTMIAGGTGRDRISVEGGLDVLSTVSFAKATSIEELYVTGTGLSTIVLDASAETAGIDTINISTSVRNDNIVNLREYTTLGVTIVGSATGTNELTGGSGDDTITGGADHDMITGGSGADQFYIDAGVADDIIADDITDFGFGGADKVVITNGAAVTAFVSENYSATAAGDIDNQADVADALFMLANDVDFDVSLATDTTNGITISAAGNAAASIVVGTNQDDVIIGGLGADTITGGAGADVLTGGGGIDTFNVDADADTMTDLGQGGADLLVISQGAIANAAIHTAWTATSGTVNTGLNTSANAVITTSGLSVNLDAAKVTTTGSAIQGYSVTNTGVATTLRGSDAADSITGGTGNDTVYGGDGADTITGGDGDDGLVGNAGADLIYGNDGDDAVNGGKDNDTIWGGDGNDNIDGGSTGDDDLYGEGGNDTIDGKDGNDTITGDAGADSLTGGLGIDDFVQGLADSELGIFTHYVTAGSIRANDTISFAGGLDIITDFNAGRGGDRLDVSASGGIDFTDVISGIGLNETALTADQVIFLSGDFYNGVFTIQVNGMGDDTLIILTANAGATLNVDTNQSMILLQDVDSGNLVNGNFIF